ncbi:hypothetical protein E5221_28450 [Pseudomonas sp. A2]|nr:hypothetical protein E5221_28450 [Pseudomonas sp. A2]
MRAGADRYCTALEACAALCRSGLVSRKGCEAAPGFSRRCTNCWGCFAALSRHKAAPTGTASTWPEQQAQKSPQRRRAFFRSATQIGRLPYLLSGFLGGSATTLASTS